MARPSRRAASPAPFLGVAQERPRARGGGPAPGGRRCRAAGRLRACRNASSAAARSPALRRSLAERGPGARPQLLDEDRRVSPPASIRPAALSASPASIGLAESASSSLRQIRSSQKPQVWKRGRLRTAAASAAGQRLQLRAMSLRAARRAPLPGRRGVADPVEDALHRLVVVEAAGCRSSPGRLGPSPQRGRRSSPGTAGSPAAGAGSPCRLSRWDSRPSMNDSSSHVVGMRDVGHGSVPDDTTATGACPAHAKHFGFAEAL